MWSLKGKDKTDCLALRELLYARYNALDLPFDWNDPDVINALAQLDKFLLGKGLTRDDVTFDMWTGTLWTKAEMTNGDCRQYRIDNGFIS